MTTHKTGPRHRVGASGQPPMIIRLLASRVLTRWLIALALVMLVLVALAWRRTGHAAPATIEQTPATARVQATAHLPLSHATILATTVSFHAGCVIRGDNGWHIHENDTHYCGALSGVHTETDGDLIFELRSGEYGAVAVEDMYVEEDETFSKFADCGPSGGLGIVTVRCWDKDNPGHLIKAQDARWNSPYGNLWFGINWRVPA